MSSTDANPCARACLLAMIEQQRCRSRDGRVRDRQRRRESSRLEILGSRVEESRPRARIAAEQRRSKAPAAAADQLSRILDHEISLVGQQLAVDAERPAQRAFDLRADDSPRNSNPGRIARSAPSSAGTSAERGRAQRQGACGERGYSPGPRRLIAGVASVVIRIVAAQSLEAPVHPQVLLRHPANLRLQQSIVAFDIVDRISARENSRTPVRSPRGSRHCPAVARQSRS